MYFLIGFIICVAMALIHLPFVLECGDNWLNLASMIFCGSMAVFQLVMAALTIKRY